MKCGQCGWEVDPNAPYCPRCGAQIRRQSTADTVWLVLAILLMLIVGAPALLLGGCFLILSPIGTPGTEAVQTAAIGIGLILVFVATLAFVIFRVRKMNRR